MRALKNVPGIYINAENCQFLDTLNLDDVPVYRKCTCYWATYEDQFGTIIESDKKAWITDFQIDQGFGKCDLNFKVRVEQPPTVSLNDWLCADVFVQLHRSQPKVVEKR